MAKKESETSKPAEGLDQVQEQIERQAQELAKQAAAQQAQTVSQDIPPEQAPAAQAQQRQIALNEAEAKTAYSNFCYTAGTREGVFFGFGFHDWQPAKPIKVDAKVEMSYYNAKRLLATLSQIVKRHETAFGELEVDINKRLKIKPA